MLSLASNHPSDPIDVIIGDWMSEANMTTRAGTKIDATADAYEPTFLEALQPALPHIAKHSIKIACNAGASDTRKLWSVVQDRVQKAGLKLKVAWISGDEVLPQVKRSLEKGESKFVNICTDEELKEWKFEPMYAQAYLGGLGIAAAFAKGADIVVCGRVSDASPVIGAAVWWHHWQRNELDKLANAFVAGHLIECSTYVTGGNFSGFMKLEHSPQGWHDLGFPIAEISHDGQVVITKQKNTAGEVSVDTCTSQLLYEIQGPWYYNSDVTAILNDLWFDQLAPNHVALRGVKSGPPPPTTKVGITARGGYQAEVHWFLCGLDIAAKAAMIESQIRHELRRAGSRFTRLAFTLNGTAPDNPTNQNAATVDFRVFAQAAKAEDLAPDKFFRPAFDVVMQAYPGATPHMDIRQGFPKPIFEYYVTLLPQTDVQHTVNLWDGQSCEVPTPPLTKVWERQQPSQPVTSEPAHLSGFGRTTRGPLGWIVHARSGDKVFVFCSRGIVFTF
jgi:Acyclic terpene utilisation family protein AtuA